MPLNAQNIKLLTSEIHIMKESNHPNVVKYFDSFRVEDKLWVAMEYMGGGCLTEILEQFDYCHMGEDHISWVCQEVCKGVARFDSDKQPPTLLCVDPERFELHPQPAPHPSRH